MKTNTILQGDSLEVLKTLPDESIDMVITSPPYWALRDYGTNDIVWDADKNCNHSWVKNIKKPSGGKGSKNANVGANKNDSANMRDHDVISNFCSNCTAWKGSFGLEPTFDLYIKHLCDIFDEVKRVLKKEGTCWVNIGDTYAGSGRGPEGGISKETQAKSLIQIPSRFAIEMTNRGWILRNEIIWHKPNAMPSSVKDRFTVDFEKIFFFTKNKKYFFEQQKEPHAESSLKARGSKLNQTTNKGASKSAVNVQLGDEARGKRFIPEGGRNKRTVWKIPTKSFKEAHFAVYPPKLIETPIKAGCPEGGIVLDIFMGSGTTGVVARQLGRNYLGIELNEEYIKIAEQRLSQGQLL